MTQWLLLEPDEDGNPTRWLTDDELEDLLENANDQGIARWVTPETWKDADPSYWEEGDAMLIKVERIVVPREVAYKYSID